MRTLPHLELQRLKRTNFVDLGCSLWKAKHFYSDEPRLLLLRVVSYFIHHATCNAHHFVLNNDLLVDALLVPS